METAETAPLPKTSRRRSRWLRRLLWAVVWVISLIALFYVHQGWQGRRAWKAYVAEAEAAGERLDPESIIPPPIPDEENLAMAPMFKPLFEYERGKGPNKETVWNDPAHKKALESLELPGNAKTSSTPIWRNGALVDLRAWQKRFADAGKLEPSDDPAQDVLKVISDSGPWLQQLEQAAESRPKARFPIRYADAAASHLPHASVLQGFSQLLRLRAIARLHAGQRDQACGDLLLMLRLRDAIAAEPLMISYLVAISIEEMALHVLWEGLALHRWTDENLRKLQEQTALIDHGLLFQRSLRGERNLFAFPTMEMMRSNRWNYLGTLVTDSSHVLVLIPGGWLDLNKAEMGRACQQLLGLVDAEPLRFYPERMEAMIHKIDDGIMRDPRLILARLATPVYFTMPRKGAGAQGSMDLASIALALERHRLRHETYPVALEAIDEDLRGPGGIPRDCATGRPAHYALRSDGTYKLYFDGWNGQDDGGKAEFRKGSSTSLDDSKGDWVWPQPVAP